MRLDDVMSDLREGKPIYRETRPEIGYLQGSLERVYGSFYLTIYDVLAKDWTVGKPEEDDE